MILSTALFLAAPAAAAGLLTIFFSPLCDTTRSRRCLLLSLSSSSSSSSSFTATCDHGGELGGVHDVAFCASSSHGNGGGNSNDFQTLGFVPRGESKPGFVRFFKTKRHAHTHTEREKGSVYFIARTTHTERERDRERQREKETTKSLPSAFCEKRRKVCTLSNFQKKIALLPKGKEAAFPRRGKTLSLSLRVKRTKGTRRTARFLALEVHLRRFGLFRAILFTLGGVMGDKVVILWSRKLKSVFGRRKKTQTVSVVSGEKNERREREREKGQSREKNTTQRTRK